MKLPFYLRKFLKKILRQECIPDGGYVFAGKAYSTDGDLTGTSNHGQDEFWIVKLEGGSAPLCLTPVNEVATNIKSISAKVNWNPVTTANKYKLQYRATGNSVWTNTSSTNTYKKLNNLIPSTQYEWQVKSVCTDAGFGKSEWSPLLTFTTKASRLAEDEMPVTGFEIFPNPVSSSSIIEFTLNQASLVSVKVISVDGKEVMMIMNENLSEGNHQLTFNRQSLTAGIYFLQLKTNGGLSTKKIIIE